MDELKEKIILEIKKIYDPEIPVNIEAEAKEIAQPSPSKLKSNTFFSLSSFK